MKHGIQTIVITTTEQAEAMLEHLKQCETSAKADGYASERKGKVSQRWARCDSTLSVAFYSTRS